MTIHRSNNAGTFPYLLFLGGLALLYYGMKQYLFIQKIKNTPTSKTKSVALGLVELAGTAEFNRQIVSPISKVPCAYWKVVWQYYYSGKNGGWIQFHSYGSSSRFYLKDETGKVLIESNGAEMNIPFKKRFEGTITGKGMFGLIQMTPLPKEIMDYLNSLDPDKSAPVFSLGDKYLRVIEYYIANEDQLYVLGTAEPIEGASSSVGYENIIVRKGKSDKTMVISNKTEKKVIMSKFKYVLGYILLGLFCLVIGLLMILSDLKIS